MSNKTPVMNHSIQTFRVEEFKIEDLLDFLKIFDKMNNDIRSEKKNYVKKGKAIAERNNMMEEFYRKNPELMPILEIVSSVCTIKRDYKIIVDGKLSDIDDSEFSGMIRQKPNEPAMFDDSNSSKTIAHLSNKQFCEEFDSLFHQIRSQKESVVPDLSTLILIIINSLDRGAIGTVINILGKIPKQKEGIFAEKNPWDIPSILAEMNEEDRIMHLKVLLKPFEDKMSYFSFIFTTSAMEIIIPKCRVVNASPPEKVIASPKEVIASHEEVIASPSKEVIASPEVTNVSVASYANPTNESSFTIQPYIVVLQQYPSGLTVPLYLDFNRIILECYVDVIYYIPFYSTKENPNYLIGFSPRHGRVDIAIE